MAPHPPKAPKPRAARMPDLSGASCATPEHRYKFDLIEGVPSKRQRLVIWAAKQTCAACPVLQRCSDWVDSLAPIDVPKGATVAGTFISSRR